MTLKEAIVSLPWDEIGRPAYVDYINDVLTRLGASLILPIFMLITIVGLSKYAIYYLKIILPKIFSNKLKQSKIYKDAIKWPTDEIFMTWIKQLSFIALGAIIVLLSYALTSWQASFVIGTETAHAPVLQNDMSEAAQTIRHYLTYTGLVSVSLIILAGFAVVISAVGGQWFRNLAKLLFTVSFAIILVAGFFDWILN